MTPAWLNDSVRAFGRQMGLGAFRLGENGVAGVRFENGLTLRFEYAAGALMVLLGVPAASDEATLRQLLTASHSAVARGLRVRTGYLTRTGEALFTIRLDEREVTVSALETVFRALWSAADRLRRVAS